ncbi:hypothetical protein O3P69_004702 [Scylla paramamosain]|uniref:Anti-microbial Scy2 n=3 Tax=Scylla TaxID=6760 RepID=A9NJG5_SCYSE|nr:scygonadin 2 precursor [Scylla serrata]ABU40183.1 anti-microbial Scy2 precursor [Scylla serrata]ABU40184.1 anti-microbial Scy2 precursor [Scylla serrata]
MRPSFLFGLTVVVLLGVSVPACQAGLALNRLMNKAVDAIVYMVGQQDAGVSLLGHPCLVESAKQPEGIYTAVMSCASWTPRFVGEGTSEVELEALKGSIRSFIRKASDYQLLSKEDLEDWLASY